MTEAPENPQIIGNQVRQAPKNSATGRIRHSSSWVDTALTARYNGKRYEDDLNTLPADSYIVLDLVFTHTMNSSTEVFLSIENLLDEEYEIRSDSNGVSEIGRPRFDTFLFFWFTSPSACSASVYLLLSHILLSNSRLT